MVVEVQLLNYVLGTGDFNIITQNAITVDMFTKYAPVFKFIRDHFNTYKTVPDKLTVVDKFEDFEVTEVSESPDYLVNKIYEEHQFRMGAPKLQEAFEKYKEDSNKGIEAFKQILPTLSIQPVISTNSLIKNADKRLIRYRERAMNPLRNYITTGYEALDKTLGGWDREEDLVILFARPGKGKSWVAVKSAMEAARAGFKVFYYSGEIGDDLLGYRLDTSFSNISNYKLTHSDASIMAEYEKVIEDIKNIKGDVEAVTPADIGGFLTVSKLRSLVEKNKPDIIFIDQISLMDDDRKGKSESERTTNIMKDLTSFRAEKRIPLVIVSQQNREDAEKGVGTENISNSDRIGQDATVVISIERKDPDLLMLKVVKSRFSTAGDKFTYHWKIDKGEFEYIPTEGDTSSSEDTSSNTSSYSPQPAATTQSDLRRSDRRQETADLRNQFKDRRRAF